MVGLESAHLIVCGRYKSVRKIADNVGYEFPEHGRSLMQFSDRKSAWIEILKEPLSRKNT